MSRMKNIEELGLKWLIKYKKLEHRELIKCLKNKNIESVIGYITLGVKSYRLDEELRLDKTKRKIIIYYPYSSVTREENYKEFLSSNIGFLFNVKKIKFIDGEEFEGLIK